MRQRPSRWAQRTQYRHLLALIAGIGILAGPGCGSEEIASTSLRSNLVASGMHRAPGQALLISLGEDEASIIGRHRLRTFRPQRRKEVPWQRGRWWIEDGEGTRLDQGSFVWPHRRPESFSLRIPNPRRARSLVIGELSAPDEIEIRARLPLQGFQ